MISPNEPFYGFENLFSAGERIVAPRRTILRQQEVCDLIPLICSGWAACSLMLPDRRRRLILSFLLPGDIASTTIALEPVPHFSIEAVTSVHIRTVRHEDLKATLMRDTEFLERFLHYSAEQKIQADMLAIDLGYRSAEGRIARLILRLATRLKQRGLSDGVSFDFPLRQHHIGDATGLSNVHVSKVLVEFRHAGYVEINERSLRIKNQTELVEIANFG
jgi:CRP-like cAMP-binding protein